jgi:hypothetical protein
MVTRNDQIRHSLNPPARAQGNRADRINRWPLEQSEDTARMASSATCSSTATTAPSLPAERADTAT